MTKNAQIQPEKHAFSHPLVGEIVDFLRQIGLEVRAGTIMGPTVLPGIDIYNGVLVIDESNLLFPGDLLHEAGHLAVATPQTRCAMHRQAGDDGAEEMMAIAWSYAAALHLKIDPAVVFHPHGYRGGSASLLENFQGGRYVGLPMLQWVGLAYDAKNAAQQGAPGYPQMRRWLREA